MSYMYMYIYENACNYMQLFIMYIIVYVCVHTTNILHTNLWKKSTIRMQFAQTKSPNISLAFFFGNLKIIPSFSMHHRK